MKKVIVFATLCFSFVLTQGASLPTRAQVEENGKKPYPRYTVPAGKMSWCPSSIFEQPRYDQDKDAIDKMQRKPASELGLAGVVVCNEYPGQMSPYVVLLPRRSSNTGRPHKVLICICLIACSERNRGIIGSDRCKRLRSPSNKRQFNWHSNSKNHLGKSLRLHQCKGCRT